MFQEYKTFGKRTSPEYIELLSKFLKTFFRYNLQDTVMYIISLGRFPDINYALWFVTFFACQFFYFCGRRVSEKILTLFSNLTLPYLNYANSFSNLMSHALKLKVHIFILNLFEVK